MEHRRAPAFSLDLSSPPSRPPERFQLSQKPDGGWMSYVILGGLLIILFGYPMVSEQASGPCSALELKATNIVLASDPKTDGSPIATAMVRVFAGMAHGEVATALVKREYPNLPPMLTCDIFYWKMTFNPASARAFIPADHR